MTKKEGVRSCRILGQDTFLSHSAPLHPGVKMATVPLSAELCDGLALDPGGSSERA